MHRETKRKQKVLFLGTGSSGKSTLLKNLKEVNGQSMMDVRTVTETALTMRTNVITMMHNLCEKSAYYSTEGHEECTVEVSHEVAEAVTFIAQYGENSQKLGEEVFASGGAAEQSVPDDVLPILAKAVSYMWSLDAIKATYALRGGRFFMEENIDYFFDRCADIFDPDYVVTREDVIKTRVRTTGVCRSFFPKNVLFF